MKLKMMLGFMTAALAGVLTAAEPAAKPAVQPAAVQPAAAKPAAAQPVVVQPVVVEEVVVTETVVPQAAPAPSCCCPVKDWTVFQVGFLPGVPEVDRTVGVAGVKAGLPLSDGQATVRGVDASFFGSGASRVTGAQISSAAVWADKVEGLQLAPVTVAKRCDGLQFGVVNVARTGAVQIGLVNYIADSPVPWMILCNVYFGSKEAGK